MTGKNLACAEEEKKETEDGGSAAPRTNKGRAHPYGVTPSPGFYHHLREVTFV